MGQESRCDQPAVLAWSRGGGHWEELKGLKAAEEAGVWQIRGARGRDAGILWDLGELTHDDIGQVGDGHCWAQLGSGAENVTWCQRR